MLNIVKGIILDSRVTVHLCPRLDHGPMPVVHGIILHQTGGSAITSAFGKYENKKSPDRTGAHFLIDNDGTLYQTLQVNRCCAHVAPIKSRCLVEMSCTAEDTKAYAAMEKVAGNTWNGVYARAEGNYEAKKSFPLRFPYNPDAIGIEVVGKPAGKSNIYENPTIQQNDTVHWLVAELLQSLKIGPKEVYRHPVVSRKNDTEAQGITW